MRGAGRVRRMKEGVQAALYRMFALHQVEERHERERLALEMGFIGQFDEHRRFQMAFLKEQSVNPSASFLEIGCGPLTLGVPLIGYLDPCRYTGIDVRNSVLDVAYAQIGKHNLAAKNPRLIASASFGAEELGDARFDVVWSFSVLFHLTDEQVGEIFHQVHRRLAADGRYWANINPTIGNSDSRWLDFPFMRRAPEFYEELGQAAGLAMRQHGTLGDLGFRLEGLERENLLLEFMIAA